MRTTSAVLASLCLLAAACAPAHRPAPAVAQAAAVFPAKPSGTLGLMTKEGVDASMRADLGLPADLDGILILGAMRGYPGQACGLGAGDFLTAIDGRPLTSIEQVKAVEGGSKVTIEARRGGKTRTASCVLGYYPAVLGLMVNGSPSGLQLNTPPDPIVGKTMKRMGWPDHPVFIRAIDGRPVSTFDQVKSLLADRRPLETVTLELESARTKKPQKIEVKLNEGSLQAREFAEEPPTTREPRTLTVSAAGDGDYKTVAGALFMSQPGDTVLLRAGRYKDPVTLSSSRRTLRGEGPATVLETGFIVTGTDGVVVEDLAVEMAPGAAGDADAGAGGRMRGLRAAVARGSAAPVQKLPASGTVRQARGTVLRRLTLTGGFGLHVWGSQDTVIENCVSRGAKVGLAVSDSPYKVLNSVFHDNDIGLQATGDSVGTLRGLTVADNRAQGVLIDGGRVELYDSILSGTQVLLLCQRGCRFSGGYNDYFEGSIPDGVRKDSDVSVDPLFAERLKSDFRLSLESPLIGRGRGGGHIGALPPAGSGAGSEGFR